MAAAQMTAIREVMSTQLATVEPPTSVAAAVTVMGMRRIGAVLVLEAGKLEGIFTERDLVRALSFDIAASNQPVAHWMTRNPVTVGPDTTVEHALEIMLARNFRHLPVMDEGNNTVVGVVSIRDLSRAALRD